MSEDPNKPAGDQFEENLRQILSPEAPADGTKPQAARPQPRPTGKIQETADKLEAEGKTLFWFKLMRPIAVLTLLGLMALFVARITAER